MPVVHLLRGQERLSCRLSGQWTWRMAGEVLTLIQLAQKIEVPVTDENSDKQTRETRENVNQSAERLKVSRHKCSINYFHIQTLSLNTDSAKTSGLCKTGVSSLKKKGKKKKIHLIYKNPSKLGSETTWHQSIYYNCIINDGYTLNLEFVWLTQSKPCSWSPSPC